MNANREPSDEELDGLFRQAADGLRPRFDPADWRDMSARLDATPPPARPWWQRWNWLSLAALLLLLSGGSLWWGATKSEKTLLAENRIALAPSGVNTGQRAVSTGRRVGVEKPAAGSVTSRRTESPATEAGANAPTAVTDVVTKSDRVEKTPRLAPTKTSVNTATDRAETTPAARPAGRTVPLTTVRVGLSAANGSAKRRASPGGSVARTGGRNRARETTSPPPRPGGSLRKSPTELARTDERANRTRRERNPSRVIVVKAGNGDVARLENADFGNRQKASAENADFAQQPEAPERLSVELARMSLKPWRVANRPMQLPDVSAPTLAEPLIDRSPSEPTRRGRFGLRAVLAPDLNSVGTFKPSVFGRSYGLLLEYEVLPRLRVQTGVIRSQKDYGSTPADYKWESGYWSKYPKPDNIDAKCALLDLPINVRFDVFRRAQFDVFVNGGVSSYLMLNEDYTYRYAAKPSYTHEINVPRGGGHFATTFNLSLGYQRQLGSGLSLQLEPYLKLPLAGVGFGSVRLYSTGLHLSLGFHPLNRRRSPP